jgi:hypothetical protein
VGSAAERATHVIRWGVCRLNVEFRVESSLISEVQISEVPRKFRVRVRGVVGHPCLSDITVFMFCSHIGSLFGIYRCGSVPV